MKWAKIVQSKAGAVSVSGLLTGYDPCSSGALEPP